MCVCVVVSENVCGCVFGCEWWVSVRAHVRSSRWRLGQGDLLGLELTGVPGESLSGSVISPFQTSQWSSSPFISAFPRTPFLYSDITHLSDAWALCWVLRVRGAQGALPAGPASRLGGRR